MAPAEARVLTGFPFGIEQIPPTGFFKRSAQADGIERLYGYQLIPEYGLIVTTGHPASELNLVINQERHLILAIVTAASAVIIGLFALLLRGDRQRAQAINAMRSTEAMLQSSIDAIGEAFAIYDQQDRLAYFNQRYQAIFRLSGAVIERGRRFEDIMRTAAQQGEFPDAVGREDAWIAERVASHQNAWNDQIQQLSDGTWLRIRERRTPEGHVVGFRIDITELVEARQAAEEAREAAEDANRLKTEFLANMSHELRTPLTGIVGMSEVLLRTTLDEHQREVLGYLTTCSERLRGLVADLLDYAALESGTLSIEGQEFSPRGLIEEAARDASGAARAKGLALAVEPDPAVPEVVCGDPYRLRQVLHQLIDNAIKFTNTGGVTVSTFCTPASGPDKLRLGFAIRDTGIGIADEDRELIFLPFTQKDGSSSRLQGGTGLGLSLASGIIAQMGGAIGVDSVPGYGSEFRFTVEVAAP
jgi:signal transduction histidine kinase